MPLGILLLAATISRAPLPSPAAIATTLILRNGTRFEVNGPIREEQSRVIFRTAGVLYSIPLGDVDLEATRAAVTKAVVVTNESDRKLKVSAAERDRLLRELEQNHSGKASVSSTDRLAEVREVVEPPNGDEWSWRNAARSHEEAIRRAKENVELLRTRAEALKQQITQFFALGYRASQFTYQSTELQYTLDQLPAAELEVTRAQRANDQFRDDARRMGIMPGWLR
ncbi:MAG: hypothetical protein QOC81_2735 [Thermoanaerobaculia bacterium]|jgi:hypothetical protein|nr:hypothetical protein [Thermoanaerobaculia bacterium]